ncbi:MAG: HAD family hydrolase, partial [Gammaproteobacteria bacterium]|nr:HAD family hydrolase [Gammaproteobacteria bacterium]
MDRGSNKIYIVLISVHGLIRGNDLELGRDADTGGQTKYVLELTRALGKHPDVARVDLLTRTIIDPQVSGDYALHI